MTRRQQICRIRRITHRQCRVVADDIVNAILFFLAESSSFLTGVALDVDGGLLSTSTLPGVDR